MIIEENINKYRKLAEKYPDCGKVNYSTEKGILTLFCKTCQLPRYCRSTETVDFGGVIFGINFIKTRFIRCYDESYCQCDKM